jgi:catechol 2,3-dioxygenase-like lactoylglutathione lyase family enzyme
MKSILISTDINIKEVTVSRVQLALNVSDLNETIAFYSKLFAAEPAKVRPGYANFAISEPPLKLVLIEGAGEPGSINHLGVEVGSTEEVSAAAVAFTAQGIATDVEEATTCCYAVQDKVWVDGPDRARWEFYTVLADAPGPEGLGGDEHCCTPALAPVAGPAAATATAIATATATDSAPAPAEAPACC